MHFSSFVSRRSQTVLSFTALGVASALALAGCAPAGGADSDDNTITVWHYYSLDNQNAMLDQYKSEFEATNDGVTVENVYVPQDQLNSKLIAAVGSGTGPDVVVFDGYSATTLTSGGVLAAITDEWSGFDGADQIAEGAVTTVSGDVYSVQGYVNTLGLFYNKTILDELGIEPPTTVDQLEDGMAKATAAGHQGITLSGQPDVQGAFQAFPWLTEAGFDYAKPNADALSEGYARVRGWIDNGYLSAQAPTWDQNVPFAEFMNGNTAFAENGNWQLSSLESDATFDYGVVPLPVGTTGKVYLGGEAEGIGAFSKNPALAWKYLEETFLSKAGQLVALDQVGSLPTRADASADDSISADPYLSQFAEAIATQGAPFPDTIIPPENNEAVINANGQAWSAALGGQTSPDQAASDLIKVLEPLLQK